MEFLNIQDILKFFSNFYKLFDVVRVIDTEKNQVICSDGSSEGYKSVCYGFWEKDSQCSDCVAMLARSEKDTFIKIEYFNGRAFLVLASPVRLRDEEYIVEMVKDITETGIITNLSYKNIKEANSLIFELNVKTIIDDLTGCYNRRYINERLPADIYNATVNNESLSVMMLDIDFFKKTNDTYGHLAGDKVLKELCSVIKSKIRENFDWLARFGGEEFLIILPNADIGAAYETAERIRSSWENKVIRHENYLIKTTISIGSYTVHPGSESFESILEAVDKNLYKAKNSGRNRVEAS